MDPRGELLVDNEKKSEIISNFKTEYEEEPKSEKLNSILAKITVEPLLLLYIMSSTMYQQVTANLYLEKTCRVFLAYNASVCDAMSERNISGYTEDQEAEVQKHVSKLIAVSTLIQGLFPVCLMLFLGSWSDRHSRRKPLILAPILGEITAVILLILNTVSIEIPVILTVICTTLPPAITGGWPCLFLGVYSYVSSTSNDNNKTAKIGACSTIQNIGFICGIGSSGLLFGYLGFIGVYSLCLAMLLISMVYGYWRIKDVDLKQRRLGDEREEKNPCADFFSIKHFMNTLKVCFNSRSRNRRTKMIIMMLLTVFVLGAMQGEYAVVYLYTRMKFGWSELDFSLFFTVHSLMDVTGAFIALVIFSKYFKWNDASLGILALSTNMCANMMYAFAPTYKYFYAGMIPDIFYGTTSIALRSLMAKIVPPHELGQSNSVFGVCEAIMPSIFGPIYTTAYKTTIQYFPGAFYFISFGMYSIGICLFIWLNRCTENNRRNQL